LFFYSQEAFGRRNLDMTQASDLRSPEREVIDDTFVYKIGLVGPTQVGKTTTITALLNDANELLAATGVKIEARGKLTQKRLARNYNALSGSLLAKEFNPGQLEGTQESFVFNLAMTAYGSVSELDLAILDYPGGWLTDPPEGPQQADWEYCKEWIADSTVLIVPIDATVVMNARTAQEQAAALETLGVFETIAVARDWARGRYQSQEPGLLLLVPVKCESYFNDNGGDQDQGQELFERVYKLYYDLIDAVTRELSPPDDLDTDYGVSDSKTREQRFLAGLGKQIGEMREKFKVKPNYSIQYHPIDTIGCVKIKSARWQKNTRGELLFHADYKVRPPARRCTCGVGGLLVAICKQMYREQRNSEGLFGKLWVWLTGDNTRIVQAIEKLNQLGEHPRMRHIKL
jgi:hypothetical protein